jgi:hypothetical protein
MTTGQRERIVYRVVEHTSRAGSFLPPHGVGYGLDESGLGIILNRTVKGMPKYRAVQRTVTGTVIDETSDFVTVERDDGRRLRIPVSDIIKRTLILDST